MHSLTIFFIFFKLTFIPLSVFMNKDSISMKHVLFPLAKINFALFVLKNSISMFFLIYYLSLVSFSWIRRMIRLLSHIMICFWKRYFFMILYFFNIRQKLSLFPENIIFKKRFNNVFFLLLKSVSNNPIFH
jgi:hypothetical protein